MNKPAGYDEVQTTGDFTPIQLGGHKLIILGVKEVKLGGYDAITVQVDMAQDDIQPNYYQKAYKEDTRKQKKYGGNINIFTQTSEYNGKKTSKLKSFLTSVENSNQDFQVQWGEEFCQHLKGKFVGGVFGEEEYLNDKNEVKTARKLRYFRKIDGVLDADIPEKKVLQGNTTSNEDDSFMNLTDKELDALPFA